jgi:fibronectin type 3 domain-containing protein
VDGATKYAVYRATSAGGSYKLIGKTSSTSYTNKKVSTGTTYYYKVKAYHKSAYGAYSTVASTKTVLLAPAPTAAVASPNSILLSWGAVPGATKYEVWTCATVDGTYTLLSTAAAKTYAAKNLAPGTYYYKVKAYRLVGKVKVYSDDSAPVSKTLGV